MSTLDPMEERAAATILVEATDPATAAADAGVAAFLQSCADLLGREAASIMDLRWRRDLEVDEISTRLSIPVEWVRDQLSMLPALFGNMVRSRVLWYGGRPRHDELASQLSVAGATTFDATTSRSILAHARMCEICDDYTTMQIEPIFAFAETAPLTSAPDAVAPDQPTIPMSPAAERIAAATAAGAAAAAAAAAAGAGAGAAAAPGTSLTPQYTSIPPVPTPAGPRLAPISGVVAEEEAKKKKRLLIGAAVGAVVILLLVGFTLFGGGSGNDDLASEGPSPTTVENKVYQSTSSTTSTTPTTRAPTTTTTEEPLVPDTIAATINGGSSANVPQGFSTASANINWVTTVAPVPAREGSSYQTPVRRVEVSGPGVTNPQQPETGSMSVCPSAEPDLCNVVPGAYEYTVTLYVNEINMGSVVLTLTVDPPPPPPPADPPPAP